MTRSDATRRTSGRTISTLLVLPAVALAWALGSPADAAAQSVTVTVDLAGTGSGTVTSNPAGINCTGSNTSCTASFTGGAALTLTATPSSGHAFLGWTGICSGTGTCQFNAVDGALAIAHFQSPTGPAVTYYHLDAIGSVRALTDGSGTVVIRHDYFPFGEDTQAMTGDPLRFTSQEIDAESGLHYFQARQYRQIWGRFTTVDPGHVNGSLEDPQGWNGYGYARNNPLKYVDHDGRRYSVCYESCKEMFDIEFDDWIAQLPSDVWWNPDTGIITEGIEPVGMAYQISIDVYDTFLVARPVEGSFLTFLHTAVFIMEPGGALVRQYSLALGQSRFDLHGTTGTYETDRAAFEDSFVPTYFAGPGDIVVALPMRFLVDVPDGSTSNSFARSIAARAREYNETYYLWSQNSNSAAAGIVYRSGGRVPLISGAPGLYRFRPR
jgi:RHS repeat-associated protein